MLRRAHPFVVALCLVLATPARGAIEVDADPQADFGAYETFTAELRTPTRTERAMHEITTAITDGVAARGLRPVTADPDLRVLAYVLVDAHSLEELSDESQWEFWTGVRNITAYDIGEGTLVLDFVDTATGRIVWRGLTSERLGKSVEANYNRLPKIVRKLLARYPSR